VTFDEAISEHIAWKQRLRRILLGRERRHIPERTEAIESQECPLGTWLHAEAPRLFQDPLFREVEHQHRLSHDLAIQLVLNDETDHVSMDVVFQIGQFQMASQNLLESLEKLRRKHGLSETPLCVIPSGHPRGDDHLPPDAQD
jgi:nucleotide-binding universal stress UspA family protein